MAGPVAHRVDLPASGPDQAASRSHRRKVRTRQQLVDAARAILLERGSVDVSIQQITDRADVSVGSFYNHFEDKPTLFRAAVGEILEEYGIRLDALTGAIDDPAEVFATNLRITAGLAATAPEVARVFVEGGMHFLVLDNGLAPRARRDIQRAIRTGRFTVSDADVVLACTAGCLFSHLQSGVERPPTDHAATDEMTELLLTMFGLPAGEAQRIAHLPLPDGSDRTLDLTGT